MILFFFFFLAPEKQKALDFREVCFVELQHVGDAAQGENKALYVLF